LDVVESYLDIEQARFEERLKVRISLPSSVRSVPLPALLLQPLVENAVKHGIQPSPAGGEVSISVRWLEDHFVQAKESGKLLIEICDSGVGATPEQFATGKARGLGLANVERRLLSHYRGAASLDCHSHLGKGTRLELRIPAARMSGLAKRHELAETQKS
jgi:LytS/YehU family sensor histidine kinase